MATVARACNPNTQEAGAGGLPGVPGQPKPHIESRASLNYTERPCLEKNKTKQNAAGSREAELLSHSSCLEARTRQLSGPKDHGIVSGKQDTERGPKIDLGGTVHAWQTKGPEFNYGYQKIRKKKKKKKN